MKKWCNQVFCCNMARRTYSSHWSKHALPSITCITGTIQWYTMTIYSLTFTKTQSARIHKMYNTTINTKILHSIFITFSSTCPQGHSKKKHFKWLVTSERFKSPVHICAAYFTPPVLVPSLLLLHRRSSLLDDAETCPPLQPWPQGWNTDCASTRWYIDYVLVIKHLNKTLPALLEES